MNKKTSVWKVSVKRADFYALAKEFRIDPVIARIIRNRDVIQPKEFKRFLDPKLEDIPSAFLLKDMDKAVAELKTCIKTKAKIRIIGDYDTDGTCATWILYSGLKYLTDQVDFYIPNRVKDGYGINQEIVLRSKEDEVDLIVTCDNGISALDVLECASKLGIKVIVTDHHQLVKTEEETVLPKASAVVNPHRPDCDYPYKNICGANIALKLMQSLYLSMEKDVAMLDELRYFAAIATVGDMMPLTDENRALVKYALSTFEQCKNTGLRVLSSKLGIEKGQLKAYDIGFKISPCINAGGRLDTARLVLKLFSSETKEEAEKTADELIELNLKRKEMTLEESRKAFEILNKVPDEKKVIVVYLPDCHESIAGIVASRIKDGYHRPTLVVTKGANGLKGSARSISAYSMYEEMAKCRDLFTHFGGHRMAAGFSLPEDRLEELRDRLNQNCSLSMKELQEEIILDMELPVEYLSLSLIRQLELLEPFGMANNKPLFGVRNMQILKIRQIGKNKEYLKLTLQTEKGYKINALCFETAQELQEVLIKEGGEANLEAAWNSSGFSELKFSFIYYPSVNTYMGEEEIQIIINKFKLQEVS